MRHYSLGGMRHGRQVTMPNAMPANVYVYMCPCPSLSKLSVTVQVNHACYVLEFWEGKAGREGGARQELVEAERKCFSFPAFPCPEMAGGSSREDKGDGEISPLPLLWEEPKARQGTM